MAQRSNFIKLSDIIKGNVHRALNFHAISSQCRPYIYKYLETELKLSNDYINHWSRMRRSFSLISDFVLTVDNQISDKITINSKYDVRMTGLIYTRESEFGESTAVYQLDIVDRASLKSVELQQLFENDTEKYLDVIMKFRSYLHDFEKEMKLRKDDIFTNEEYSAYHSFIISELQREPSNLLEDGGTTMTFYCVDGTLRTTLINEYKRNAIAVIARGIKSVPIYIALQLLIDVMGQRMD